MRLSSIFGPTDSSAPHLPKYRAMRGEKFQVACVCSKRPYFLLIYEKLEGEGHGHMAP